MAIEPNPRPGPLEQAAIAHEAANGARSRIAYTNGVLRNITGATVSWNDGPYHYAATDIAQFVSSTGLDGIKGWVTVTRGQTTWFSDEMRFSGPIPYLVRRVDSFHEEADKWGNLQQVPNMDENPLQALKYEIQQAVQQVTQGFTVPHIGG